MDFLQQFADVLENTKRQTAVPPTEAKSTSPSPGESTWCALKRAVANLATRVPDDHDVLVLIGDVAVLEAEFNEPHTFLFCGINSDGAHTAVVAHYTQVLARIVCRPKLGLRRVMTGFVSSGSERLSF
jgi:hypothetical protein